MQGFKPILVRLSSFPHPCGVPPSHPSQSSLDTSGWAQAAAGDSWHSHHTQHRAASSFRGFAGNFTTHTAASFTSVAPELAFGEGFTPAPKKPWAAHQKCKYRALRGTKIHLKCKYRAGRGTEIKSLLVVVSFLNFLLLCKATI